MSALAWIFGLGALAVAFPFLFHLIRRTPKGQQPFSSLMFLRPSPPRLTRRSRLENLLLLFLRMAALLLIAFAFMRPYLFSSDKQSVADMPGRRVAILVDSSASMRRGDLWQQAIQKTQEIINGLEEKDEVSIATYDDTMQVILNSQPSTNSGLVTSVNQLLKERGPTWGSSNLATALTTACEQLVVLNDGEDAKSKLQIVVIGDLQNGSHVNELGSYQWPGEVRVQLEPVSLRSNNSNAAVRIMAGEEDSIDAVIRAHVKNSEDSQVDQFYVQHDGAQTTGNSESSQNSIPVYVPAGTSHVIRVPLDRETADVSQWSVSGDDADFDNQFYVAPIVQQRIQVRYFGSEDGGDPGEMQYYLDKALFETPARKVSLYDEKTAKPGQAFDLMVVTDKLTDEQKQVVNQHLELGRTVLIVLKNREVLESTADLLGVSPAIESSLRNQKYAMLAEIDFEHPLFQEFAKPRYNDFTKIKFWQHQRVDVIDQAMIMARLDDNSPAIWRNSVGAGTVVGLASGWQPEQSQLALSSKFLPLINSLIEWSTRQEWVTESCLVNQPIKLPVDENASGWTITKPDGASEIVGADESSFFDTDQPGIYALESRPVGVVATQTFAVNLDPRESDTAQMDFARFESFGIKMGEHTSNKADEEQMRSLQIVELENKQKIWKWLLVVAIGFLVAETWLAGQTVRKNQIQESSSPQPAA